MALDAGPLMRLGTRGSPSWPGFAPETGYVDADWSDQIAKALADGAGHTFCASGRAVGADRCAVHHGNVGRFGAGREPGQQLLPETALAPASNRLKRVVRGPYSAGIA